MGRHAWNRLSHSLVGVGWDGLGRKPTWHIQSISGPGCSKAD